MKIMAKKRVIFLSVILAVVVLFSSLTVLSATDKFLYTKQLETNVIRLDHYQYSSHYGVNFTDSGSNIFEFALGFEPRTTSMPNIDCILDISHRNDTVIDSMTLTFSSPRIISIYLETTNPRDITYVFDTKVPNTRIIKVDFGSHGSLTDFRFELVFDNRDDRPNDLVFSADLNLHYKGLLPFTGLRAHTDVDMLIPDGTEPAE